MTKIDLHLHDHSVRPAPFTCRECGKPGAIWWSKSQISGGWRRRSLCVRCHNSYRHHGMSGPEYDTYLARGCSIPECRQPAAHIDHDHSICPHDSHSCKQCRRGPLCRNHNANVVPAIEQLKSGKYDNVLAYLGLQVRFEADAG